MSVPESLTLSTLNRIREKARQTIVLAAWEGRGVRGGEREQGVEGEGGGMRGR